MFVSHGNRIKLTEGKKEITRQIKVIILSIGLKRKDRLDNYTFNGGIMTILYQDAHR